MKLRYTVRIAQENDVIHCANIVYHIERASEDSSNGICKRTKEFIREKILEGEAVIALSNRNKWMGFCYTQRWNDGFVSSCALIVHRKYRNGNIARQIKEKSLELAKVRFPHARYFGLTTSQAVMKINSRLGYKPVTYSEITKDNDFWESCKDCVHHDILISKNKKNCLCTAILYES